MLAGSRASKVAPSGGRGPAPRSFGHACSTTERSCGCHAVAHRARALDHRCKDGDAGLRGAVVGLPGTSGRFPRGARVDAGRSTGRPAFDSLCSTGGVAGRTERVLERTPITAPHSASIMLISEHRVTQDAGVVDEHVEPAGSVERRLDQSAGTSKSATFSLFARASLPAALMSSITHRRRQALPRPGRRRRRPFKDDLGLRAANASAYSAADPPARSGDDHDPTDTHRARLPTSLDNLERPHRTRRVAAR